MKRDPMAPDYTAFLSAVKDRIQTARLQAGRAVNRELVMLYWDIGRGILERQEMLGWGDAVVERFAADLRAEFPDMHGFSRANVWRMRQFFGTYSASEFLAQLARELRKSDSAAVTAEFLAQAARELAASLPWWHHVELMAKVKDPAALLYYLRATAQLGWSRSVLLNQIKGRAYERAVQEKKTHNFERALPEHFAEQAEEMLKSRYNLEFLGIARPMKEQGLEYQLQGTLPAEFKGKLPTARQLAEVAREFLPASRRTPQRKKP